MTRVAELFAFEVPTSMGKFRIIGPDSLPPDEAERIGAQIARLLPLMVNEPVVGTLHEMEQADPFAPHDHGCRCCPHVSQRAAVEGAVQAATAEYRESTRLAEVEP